RTPFATSWATMFSAMFWATSASGGSGSEISTLARAWPFRRCESRTRARCRARPGTTTAGGGDGIRHPRRPSCVPRVDLQVEVHLELVRVRAQADRVDLVLALVVDPRPDQVLGEDVALGEIGMVRLQRLQHIRQRGRELGDVLELLRGQLVEVLVHRLRRL